MIFVSKYLVDNAVTEGDSKQRACQRKGKDKELLLPERFYCIQIPTKTGQQAEKKHAVYPVIQGVVCRKNGRNNHLAAGKEHIGSKDDGNGEQSRSFSRKAPVLSKRKSAQNGKRYKLREIA